MFVIDRGCWPVILEDQRDRARKWGVVGSSVVVGVGEVQRGAPVPSGDAEFPSSSTASFGGVQHGPGEVERERRSQGSLEAIDGVKLPDLVPSQQRWGRARRTRVAVDWPCVQNGSSGDGARYKNGPARRRQEGGDAERRVPSRSS